MISCLFLMLYSTVLGRSSTESVSLHLMPFWSMEAIQGGFVETVYEKIYNVIFFVLYGILLRLY